MTFGAVPWGVGAWGGAAGPAAPATTGYPYVQIEVAFASNPGSAPVWTDISDYVRAFNTNRGRQRELDKFMAGRLQLVLANDDRRFDPLYTAGPYYPNVIPMRRVRVRATFGGVTYDLFTGFVDSWGQTYQGPKEALADVAVTDAFKFLANLELPESVYEYTLDSAGATHWWRLGEAAGETTAIDRGSAPIDGTYLGTAAGGAAGITTHDPDTAATLPGVAGSRIRASAAGIARPMSVEFWMRTTTNPAGAYQAIFQQRAGASGAIFEVGLDNTNPGKLIAFDPASGFAANGTSNVNDGAAHHVVATVDATGIARLYVDGLLEGTGSASSIAQSGGGEVTIGARNDGLQPHTGVVDEVAMYPLELSAATIAAHNTTGRTPWRGDLTGARINRILDAAGWPTADRLIDAGQSTLQSADLGGNALEAIQKVAETEQGLLFIDAAGRVRFIDRLSVQIPPFINSQAIFGDSGAELDYEDIRIDPGSDQDVVNEARVSRLEGTVQVVGDAASEAKYLRRSRVVAGLLHQTDQNSLDLANFIIGRYAEPITRVAGMVVRPPLDEANLYPQVLGRDLGDRLTVRKRPQNLGSAIEQDAQVEGIRHSVGNFDWQTSWNLSPAFVTAATSSVWDQALWDQGKWGY